MQIKMFFTLKQKTKLLKYHFVWKKKYKQLNLSNLNIISIFLIRFVFKNAKIYKKQKSPEVLRAFKRLIEFYKSNLIPCAKGSSVV